MLFFSTRFFIVWIILGLLLSYQLPWGGSWSIFSSKDLLVNYLQFQLYLVGLHPSFVLVLQILLLILFFLTIHVLLATCYVFLKNIKWMVGMAVFIFIYTIISFKRVSNHSLFFIYNYMSIHSAFYAFKSVIYPFFLLVFIALICFSLMYFKTLLSNKVFISIIFENTKYIIFVFLCLAGISTIFLYPPSVDYNTWDIFYTRFSGISDQGFSLLNYIFFCTVFIGFAYLIQINFSQLLSESFYYTIIRYGSLFRWYASIILKIIVYTSLFLLLNFMFVIFMGVITGTPVTMHLTVIDSTVSQLIYHFLINGLLQILNYFQIMFIVLWIGKETKYSLTCIGVFIIVALPVVNIFKILPVGLNSLGYLTGNKGDILMVSISLVLYLVLEFIIILYCFRKKEISFY